MSSRTVVPQLFIYGRPVQPAEFLDREAELRTVVNQLRDGEFTAVVAEPCVRASVGE